MTAGGPGSAAPADSWDPAGVMKSAWNIPALALLSVWSFNATAAHRRHGDTVLIMSFSCWETTSVRRALWKLPPASQGQSGDGRGWCFLSHEGPCLT